MQSFMAILRLNERAATETGTPKESCACRCSASKKSSSGQTIGRHRFLFHQYRLSDLPDHSVCTVLAGENSTNFKGGDSPSANLKIVSMLEGPMSATRDENRLGWTDSSAQDKAKRCKERI